MRLTAIYAGSRLGVNCRSGAWLYIFKTVSIPFSTAAYRNTGPSALVCSTTDKQVIPTLTNKNLNYCQKMCQKYNSMSKNQNTSFIPSGMDSWCSKASFQSQSKYEQLWIAVYHLLKLFLFKKRKETFLTMLYPQILLINKALKWQVSHVLLLG